MTDEDAGSVSASSKRIGKNDARVPCKVCGHAVNKSNMSRHMKKNHGSATAKSVPACADKGGLSKADDSAQIYDVSEVCLILSDILKSLVHLKNL